MNSPEGLVRIGAFAQEHDSRTHILVVDDLAVFAVNRARKLTEPNFWALRDHGNVFDPQRRPVLGHHYGVFDIADISDQPNFADVSLLQTCFDEASARIGVVVGQLLLHLRQAKSVGDQFIGVHANLIFARRPAKTCDVHHVRNRFEILLDDPVFNGFQLHHVVIRIRALEREKVNLAVP